MSAYPIILNNLEAQRVLVVGGGAIATEKVIALLDAGAGNVMVVSPQLTHALAELAAENRITWRARPYRPEDMEDAFLCIAATQVPSVNRAVARDARKARVLINVVDDPDHCDFFSVSVIRRQGFTISIGTDGQMPALAARLREQLSRGFGPEYGELIEIMRELRPTMPERFPDPNHRRRAWRALAQAPLIPALRRGVSKQAIWRRIEQCLSDYSRHSAGRKHENHQQEASLS